MRRIEITYRCLREASLKPAPGAVADAQEPEYHAVDVRLVAIQQMPELDLLTSRGNRFGRAIAQRH